MEDLSSGVLKKTVGSKRSSSRKFSRKLEKCIGKKEFRIDLGLLAKEIAKYDSDRELLIAQSRKTLKAAKMLIYSVHRDCSCKEIVRLRDSLLREKKVLESFAKKSKGLETEGFLSEANQEYAEAVCFFEFVEKGILPSQKQLRIPIYDYLMGLCDLTGELTRRAVLLASKRRYSDISLINNAVNMINGEFLKFDLRNGNLRKKYDQIKWNVKKMDEIVYDISMKKQ